MFLCLKELSWSVFLFTRLNNLNNRHLCLTLLEPEKSKNKAPADLVPDAGSLPGW